MSGSIGWLTRIMLALIGPLLPANLQRAARMTLWVPLTRSGAIPAAMSPADSGRVVSRPSCHVLEASRASAQRPPRPGRVSAPSLGRCPRPCVRLRIEFPHPQAISLASAIAGIYHRGGVGLEVSPGFCSPPGIRCHSPSSASGRELRRWSRSGSSRARWNNERRSSGGVRAML
jgi:hypothetical protein